MPCEPYAILVKLLMLVLCRPLAKLSTLLVCQTLTTIVQLKMLVICNVLWTTRHTSSQATDAYCMRTSHQAINAGFQTTHHTSQAMDPCYMFCRPLTILIEL